MDSTTSRKTHFKQSRLGVKSIIKALTILGAVSIMPRGYAKKVNQVNADRNENDTEKEFETTEHELVSEPAESDSTFELSYQNSKAKAISIPEPSEVNIQNDLNKIQWDIFEDEGAANFFALGETQSSESILAQVDIEIQQDQVNEIADNQD